jgi:hypothetical protein
MHVGLCTLRPKCNYTIPGKAGRILAAAADCGCPMISGFCRKRPMTADHGRNHVGRRRIAQQLFRSVLWVASLRIKL